MNSCERVFLNCLVLLCADGCAIHSIRHARAAALAWLKVIDAEEYFEAYDLEPERLQAATTRGQFIRSIKGRRALFAGPFRATSSGRPSPMS
ncbi:MAG: hypothetical protein ABJB09_01385 [Verrucomicrobiota bacterium]